MAATVLTQSMVYVGSLDLSDDVDQIEFGPLQTAFKDAPVFNGGGFTRTLPGIRTAAVKLHGWEDVASGGIGQTINLTSLGSQYPITAIPMTSSTVTAGDVCYVTRGILSALDRPHALGEVNQITYQFPSDTIAARGAVAHPLAARTSSSSGTAVLLTGPTAAQSLYATLHVTAFSGFSGVTVKVQSDDNSGMTTPTDRITFTAATGTTSQFASVAGDFSTETYHRVTWTVTGSGSITFVAAFGVL